MTISDYLHRQMEMLVSRSTNIFADFTNNGTACDSYRIAQHDYSESFFAIASLDTAFFEPDHEDFVCTCYLFKFIPAFGG